LSKYRIGCNAQQKENRGVFKTNLHVSKTSKLICGLQRNAI
jgi:hypothetical protein